MQTRIDYLHLHDKKELLKFKDQILTLFADCFMRQLDESLWEWLYLQNPLGDPIINLAFLDKKLIGHYAFIPIKTNQHKIFLSATTMVHPSARKYNAFFDLALRSYEFAKPHCDFIVGFPNKNSAIIHKTLFHWELEPTFIIQTKSFAFASHQTSCINLDLTDQSFLQWRLSKPNASYITTKENLIFKPYKNSLDIVYSGEAKHLEESHLPYNILTKDPAYKDQKLIDYPFAFKALNPQITPPPPISSESNFCFLMYFNPSSKEASEKT